MPMKTFSLAWITGSLLLFNMSGISYAQPDKLRFKTLSGQPGFPKIGAEKILQDREGFMWFGTSEGLYRFDGHTATAFQHNPNDPGHTLPTNLINSIHEDSNGRLWVTTATGLLQVDKRTGKATMHGPDSAVFTSTILEDQQGILWLGTVSGIARFDPATDQYDLYPSPNGKWTGCLQQDDSGRFWAVNYEGLYRFHPATGKYVFFPIVTPEGHLSTLPLWLSIDRLGFMWVATYGEGLFRMDTRDPGQFEAYNPGGVVHKIIWQIYLAANCVWLATSEGLQQINPRTNQVVDYGPADFPLGSQKSSINVFTTYLDRSDRLWVGGTNGIDIAAMRTSPFHTYQMTPSPASVIRNENGIHNILEDRNGTLWLGNHEKGLCRLDRTTQRMTPVTVNPADSRKTLDGMQWPLLEDREGRLWVGSDTDKGLYVLDRKTDRFIRYDSKINVRVLAMAPSGKMWLGGDTGEIASFDPATKTFTYFPLEGTYVFALLVSRSGEVWVAASVAGLIRLNPTTGKFTRYSKIPGRDGHVNYLFALSLYEDPEGIIWIGSAGGGLNRLDPQTDHFTYFTMDEGLPSNVVNSIMGDKRGNLWLGTGQGLSRFNPATHTFQNFDESDGLPNNNFNIGSI